MKRKILALLLTLAFALSLIGCASGDRRNADEEAEVGVVASTAGEELVDEGKDANNVENGKSRQQNNDIEATAEAEGGQAPSEPTGADTNQFEGLSVSLDDARQQELLDLFETSEGKIWLFDYLFGEKKEDLAESSDPAEDSVPVSEFDSAEDGEGQPEVEWDSLSTEEKADYIKTYLRQSDWFQTMGPTSSVKIKGYVLTDYVTLSDKTSDEVVDFLVSEKGFTDSDWVLLYSSFDANARKAVEELIKPAVPADNASELENEPEQAPEKPAANASGMGYEWLSTQIQSNPDIQNRIWSELSEEDKLTLVNEFLNSETSVEVLEQYFAEHPEEIKNAADEAGYSKEVIGRYVPFLIGGVVVLVLLVAIGTTLMVMMMKKQQSRNRKVEVAVANREPQPAIRSKYTMNPELKKLFEESPVRPVREVVTPAPQPASSCPPKERPAVQNQVVSPQPAKPVVASVDGYYAVSQNSVESARIHLDAPLVLVKAANTPTNPPVPYVHYSDNTVGLNMDYYARVGGHLPGGQNVRAWEALMDATVQITSSFQLMTVSGDVISDAAGAAGKRIQKVDRAKLNADGSVAVPGRIIFE